MSAAPYQQFTAEVPCGRVFAGVGPKRRVNSTTPPTSTKFDVDCICGKTHRVWAYPVVMVVGYKGKADW